MVTQFYAVDVSVADKHRQLVEAFSPIPDRQERLAAIVERARRGPLFPPDQRIPTNRVPGCVSPVWLTVERSPEGSLRVRGDAEAPVVRGLVRLLCELYDGASPAEVASIEPTLLEELDILRDLSPTRRHGLSAVRQRMRDTAAQFISPG